MGTKNAVSLGHYPAYVDDAQRVGARTFSVPDEAWAGMSEKEQRARNQRFLDDAMGKGSDIRLAAPLEQVRPNSGYEREIQYLLSRRYVPVLMVL